MMKGSDSREKRSNSSKAPMSGLPPLPPLTDRERQERMIVKQLQRSYNGLMGSSPVPPPLSGHASKHDWPSSPERRKVMNMTRLFDDLSQQYRASLLSFRDGKDQHEEEDEILRAQVAQYRYLSCPGKKAKATITEGPLAKTKRISQLKTAWTNRDFSKSFALIADDVAGGSLLRHPDLVSQKRMWTKLNVAQKIKASLSLDKNSNRSRVADAKAD